MKLFDVAWNEELKSVQPVAKLTVNSTTIQKLKAQKTQINPVIFIGNECFQKIDTAETILLANKIMSLVAEMLQQQGITAVEELQIDCDWTASTRENYFRLLQEVKRSIHENHLLYAKNVQLSATIRLHQIKYSNRTGIPDVDKGLLMCYNMGNLKNPASNNSILDPAELKKYVGGLSHYPLQLDIALPLFSWMVYFKQQTYKGILTNLDPKELNEGIGYWQRNLFQFSTDTTLQGIPFQRTDVLRLEESTYADLKTSAQYISNQLSPKNQRCTILFYHLDQLILNKHPQHELETLFHCFD